MAATVNLELDPIFLKALGFLHSKSKDSAEKLKALLDESWLGALIQVTVHLKRYLPG